MTTVHDIEKKLFDWAPRDLAEFEKRIIYENDIIELVKFVGGG